MENQEVINDDSLAIGTAAIVVSDHVFNGQRAVLILKNISTAGQIISISKLGQAVAGKGIVLNQGDTYSESIDAVYTPSNERVTAISSAASGVLSIHEVIYLT